MIQILVFISILLVAIVLLLAIITGKLSRRGSGIATLTAFHDLQPKDKQEAVEIIVEQKAGKKWVEQENGKELTL